MITLFDFLTNGMGRWIATIAGIGVLLLSWRVADTHQQRAIGELKAVAKVQEATRRVAKKANDAVARSADVGVRGTIDPTTRND
jgi:2-keto-3-deoxy-L-rhamnonate aldolase RhmA